MRKTGAKGHKRIICVTYPRETKEYCEVMMLKDCDTVPYAGRNLAGYTWETAGHISN